MKIMKITKATKNNTFITLELTNKGLETPQTETIILTPTKGILNHDITFEDNNNYPCGLYWTRENTDSNYEDRTVSILLENLNTHQTQTLTNYLKKNHNLKKKH